jgi:hypothetical protein
MEDHSQLYKEAGFVGISLVPMWFVVSQFTLATKVLPGSPFKAMLDVAIAGALFHLTAEESGLNHYYLTNSYAYQKSFSAEFKQNDEHCPIDLRMDWSRLGTGGIFGL